MTKVFLVSEDYIKENSNISDNLWGKFLTPAIREAQDIDLQGVLGTGLYQAVLNKVSSGDIKSEENKDYKELLNSYIRPFLLYQVITNVLPLIGTKISNLGALTTDDEKANNISQAERDRLESYYQHRTDFYCRRMQDYLRKNHNNFAELSESDCSQMKSDLDTAATTSIWLGGLRNPFK